MAGQSPTRRRSARISAQRAANVDNAVAAAAVRALQQGAGGRGRGRGRGKTSAAVQTAFKNANAAVQTALKNANAAVQTDFTNEPASVSQRITGVQRQFGSRAPVPQTNPFLEPEAPAALGQTNPILEELGVPPATQAERQRWANAHADGQRYLAAQGYGYPFVGTQQGMTGAQMGQGVAAAAVTAAALYGLTQLLKKRGSDAEPASEGSKTRAPIVSRRPMRGRVSGRVAYKKGGVIKRKGVKKVVKKAGKR